MALIDDILSKPIDFTIDENLATDPKTTTYAKNDDEMRDKWRKRIKYDELSKLADKAEDAKKTSDKKNGKSADSGETAPKHDPSEKTYARTKNLEAVSQLRQADASDHGR